MTLKTAGRRQLATFIQPDEVLMSGTLIERVAANGNGRDRARQWMHRMSTDDATVWRSARLVLPGGERLFARRAFVGTQPFLQKVITLLELERPGIARAIRRLLSVGVILRAEAEKILATPIRGESTARFCDYATDLEALVELRAGLPDGKGTALEPCSCTPSSQRIAASRPTHASIDRPLSQPRTNRLERLLTSGGVRQMGRFQWIRIQR